MSITSAGRRSRAIAHDAGNAYARPRGVRRRRNRGINPTQAPSKTPHMQDLTSFAKPSEGRARSSDCRNDRARAVSGAPTRLLESRPRRATVRASAPGLFRSEAGVRSRRRRADQLCRGGVVSLPWHILSAAVPPAVTAEPTATPTDARSLRPAGGGKGHRRARLGPVTQSFRPTAARAATRGPQRSATCSKLPTVLCSPRTAR